MTGEPFTYIDLRARVPLSSRTVSEDPSLKAPSPPTRAKPPPPPSRTRAAALPLTDGQKEALTLQALGLLNEQVEARIVHYKAELETSPELDAITAQVVAQLKAMQAVAGQSRERGPSPDEAEAQQSRILTGLLGRVFNNSSQFTSRVLQPVGRRVAKLFFESELHEKTKADKDKVIHHAEQGVFYVLQRYRNRLRAELEAFEYAMPDVKELALEHLGKLERELQLAFLSRRSPELNRVMTLYVGVLGQFLQEYLPPRIEQLARVTVRSAKTARRANSVGYKVLVDAFPDFRHEWERLFMQQMVFFCGDELLARMTSDNGEFRDETIRFFTDPHVFSESCGVLCEELYDFLCLEGFLDLPVDWRVSHAREG